MKRFEKTTSFRIRVLHYHKVTHLQCVCTYPNTFRTVLHVDPVVEVVPHRLDPQVVGAGNRVGQTSEGLDEETLWYFTFARQHHHPGMNSQTVERVWWWLLQLLLFLC